MLRATERMQSAGSAESAKIKLPLASPEADISDARKDTRRAPNSAKLNLQTIGRVITGPFKCAFCLRHTSRRWSVMTIESANASHTSWGLLGKSADSQTVREGGRGNFPKTCSSRSFDMCQPFDQFAAPLAGHLTGKCDKIASLT
jgi:hypothetical protein